MRILLAVIFFMCVNVCFSQTSGISEEQVRAELAKRGIAEEDLINELSSRGIQITDLENLTPSQLAEIEQIVEDLERRNNATPKTDVASQGVDKEQFLDVPSNKETEEVKEQIKEVIQEELQEVEPEVGIYGHSFFKNRDLSVFETSTEVKAPDTYVLGAGDKIVISIFGISREELALEIDNDGYIEVNNRRIFLKGISLGDAKRKLFDTLSRFYRFKQGEFDVSISYSRTVNVNIQGEVENPGGYTLSAVNNAFNGLVAAGGPTAIGSLREILLIRSSGEIIKLDFYSYLQNPAEITNASITEGDVLFVPVASKIVNLTGAVRRAMRYELKVAEDLSDAIDLAGGFANNANRELVQVIRTSSEGRRYIDLASNEVDNFNLVDGDRILVRSITNDLENYVEIKGAVVNPGEYENRESLTLGEALNISGLLPESRRDLAFIKRLEDDGRSIYIKVSIEEGHPDLATPLRNKDQITVFNRALYNDNQSFKISGAVRSPGAFNIALDQSITIKNALELAGGLRRDAAGVAIIHTKDPLNPKKKTYMRINLAEAFENSEFFTLGALDSLEVFSEELFDEYSSVKVNGAVNNEGTYQYGLGMTIADALTMSGGFKLGAATNRIEVSRLLVENNIPTKTVIANLEIDRDLTSGSDNLDFELKPYDEIMVRFAPEFELQQIVILEGEVKFPGKYSLIKENETVRDLILRSGGITEEAFPTAAQLIRRQDSLGVVIVKLDEVLDSKDSRFNFELKDGDKIIIPKSKEFVSIIGLTNANKLYNKSLLGEQNQLNVPFHKGKDARFYIEAYAGGIADEGSLNEIFVENANGEITRTRNYVIYRNYPEVERGSTIVVGAKPQKTSEVREREDVDWSKVLADSVGQAVSILSLLILIQRI